MTDDQVKKLEYLGVNLEETLERFVDNEALYLKCLNKLLEDKNYGNMLKGIEDNDAEAAFDAAHALKGVSANLGLNKLYSEMKIITEVFRSGSTDFDSKNLSRIDDSYKEAVRIIKEL